ncbi:hypothetical protein FRB95_010196 [Tulasnella sp. JGI-2019a]|nr:hypothetical protein FRB95_010196 [Tulasnella sp. JGI-2019a]
MSLLSRKAAEPPWEVVDYKEIAPVPACFENSDVSVISIAQRDISQIYTFDAPVSPAPPPPPNPPSMSITAKLQRRLSSATATSPQAPRRRFTLTRSSSSISTNSSASDSSSDESTGSGLTFASSTDSVHGFRKLEHPICMRDALIFARDQLLKSAEMKLAGGNVLFFEGWAVTRLRKNDRYRLQVRYFGRPAKAAFTSAVAASTHAHSIPKSNPPFMNMLEDSWS